MLSIGVAIAVAVLLVAFALTWKKKTAEPALHPAVHVQPMEKFDLETAEPIVMYPYKPVFKTTMNVGRCSHEEWLMIDKRYPVHTDTHARIIRENPTETLVMNPSKETGDAIRELYHFALTTVAQKYPQIFRVQGNSLYNTVKNVVLPLGAETKNIAPRTLFQLLIENVQEDFQLLQYDDECEEYIMRAAGCMTSVHFKWAKKLDLPLSQIHAPVPKYETNLQRPMNKNFSRLKEGQFLRRYTWVVINGSENDIWYQPPEDQDNTHPFDFDNECFARTESQILTRLPNTKFLVLAQHSYLYPMSQLKRDGMGPTLVDMFESMDDEDHEYHGNAYWQPQVVEYLRSEK